MVQKNMRLIGDGGTGTILGRYPKIPLDRRYSQESITLVLLITGSASEGETTSDVLSKFVQRFSMNGVVVVVGFM
jgi:recombinational DNA repair protein RecR